MKMIDRVLIESRAFQVGDFVLSSGQKSQYYVDCRRALMDARYTHLIGLEVTQWLSEQPAVSKLRLAGVAEGGIPLTTAVLAAMSYDGYIWNCCLQAGWVRKADKSHGHGGKLVGNLPEGSRVIVLEDVITTGDSVRDAIRSLEDASIFVESILVLVDRRPANADADDFRRKVGTSIPVHAMTTLEQLRQAAQEHAEQCESS